MNKKKVKVAAKPPFSIENGFFKHREKARAGPKEYKILLPELEQMLKFHTVVPYGAYPDKDGVLKAKLKFELVDHPHGSSIFTLEAAQHIISQLRKSGEEFANAEAVVITLRSILKVWKIEHTSKAKPPTKLKTKVKKK